ncbi:MAG: Signal recognition particle receptor FtsY [bacterium]|nr:Signal recognition particle receptor FtsY [bacterium]
MVLFKKPKFLEAFEESAQKAKDRLAEAGKKTWDVLNMDVKDVYTVSKEAVATRIEAGLEASRKGFMGQIQRLGLRWGRVEEGFYDELLEALILGDIGVPTSTALVDDLRAICTAKKIHDIEPALSELKELIRVRVAHDFDYDGLLDDAPRPWVVMLTGVNGSGKTTTAGKLAARYKALGKSVLLVAADTFRAAAIEQLEVWAGRADVEFMKQQQGSDAAAVVYDGLERAVARQFDVVIVDTAGRLQAKQHLMEELRKVRRIAEKKVPAEQITSLLVVDATTGQNGLSQARIFNEVVDLDGIVLTKLDGTAKGGIVVAIQAELGLPVVEVGVGERIDDLVPFDPEAYVEGLFEGINAEAVEVEP